MEAATFHNDILYLAWSSVAGLSIFPMQDILGFGSDCRMNTPGTTLGNWQWRCADRFITDDLAGYLIDRTRFFNRLPQQKKDDVER
jgi:4-alpha-glucanotransferase